MRKEPVAAEALPGASVLAHGQLSAEDHESWLNYLRTRKVSDLRRGASLADEYHQWMTKRARMRVKMSA